MSQKEWRPESVTGGKLVVGGEGPVESFVIDGEEHIIVGIRLTDFLSALQTEEEGRRLAEAMIRGLMRSGQAQFTLKDLESVMDWGHAVKYRGEVFSLVMDGLVYMVPSPDGDSKEVRFALVSQGSRVASERGQSGPASNGESLNKT